MFEISEAKIFEVRFVIYEIIDKIKAWEKGGESFAHMLDSQLKVLDMCGHKGAKYDLHIKEIEALEYAVMALNVLENEHLPKTDDNRNDRSDKGKCR